MRDMIERVARAMAMADDGGLDLWHGIPESGGGLDRSYYRERAKVAIKTMRKPTPAMVKAFEDAAYGSALNCWEVMIDAALGDGK